MRPSKLPKSELQGIDSSKERFPRRVHERDWYQREFGVLFNAKEYAKICEIKARPDWKPRSLIYSDEKYFSSQLRSKRIAREYAAIEAEEHARDL